MQLKRLSGLEIEKLNAENKELAETIEYLDVYKRQALVFSACFWVDTVTGMDIKLTSRVIIIIAIA